MTDEPLSTQHEQQQLDRMLDRLEAKLPNRLAGVVVWLVSPAAIYLRLPVGLLLIVGGVLSFLPVLGIEMLPLGILLLAVDVPAVRHRVVRVWPKIEARWRLLRSQRPLLQFRKTCRAE